jgi:cullin 3
MFSALFKLTCHFPSLKYPLQNTRDSSISVSYNFNQLIMVRRQGLTNHDTVDFDVTWGVLEGALREIHTKNASRLSFEELYRNAYKLVLKKKGEELYNRVSGLEQELLRENVWSQVALMVTPALILGASGEQVGGQAHQKRADGERFLRVLKDAYADHQLCMNMITDVLMYMVSLFIFLSIR